MTKVHKERMRDFPVKYTLSFKFLFSNRIILLENFVVETFRVLLWNSPNRNCGYCACKFFLWFFFVKKSNLKIIALLLGQMWIFIEFSSVWECSGRICYSLVGNFYPKRYTRVWWISVVGNQSLKSQWSKINAMNSEKK